MDMKSTMPTRGQLERELSQSIQALYRFKFGHLPSKVITHLYADRIAIVAEDTVTTIEQILYDHSKPDLARDIRIAISEAFTTQLVQKIADILEVKVVDIICDSTIDSGYLWVIAFLEAPPKVRLAKKERRRYKKSPLKSDGGTISQ